MPCDRDFGRIEKKKKKQDKFLKPSDLTDLIKSASLSSSWQIVHLEHPFTDDLLTEPDSDCPVVKVKDFKSVLEPIIKSPGQISTVRGISFQTRRPPMARHSMNGPLINEMSILKRGRSFPSLARAIESAPAAYTGFLPVKQAKFNDIKDLLQHAFLDSSVTFYSSVKGSEQVEPEETDEFE